QRPGQAPRPGAADPGGQPEGRRPVPAVRVAPVPAGGSMPAPMHAVATVHPDHLSSQLRAGGWAVVKPADLFAWLGTTQPELEPLAESWNDLPADEHLRDEG